MPKGMTAKEFMVKFIKGMTVDSKYLPCEKNSQFTRNVRNTIQKIISDTPEYYNVDHAEFLCDEREEIEAIDISVGFNPHKWEVADYKGYLYLEDENAFYEIL